MRKTLLFLSFAFFLGLTVNATDYFIASNGNDNNKGTSQSTPWRSLDKLNAQFSNMRPGDRILLRRGDTFYGSINITRSGTAGSPITIEAYGSGPKPVVTGFTEVNSWNNLGGNIWESSTDVSTLKTLNMVAIKGQNTPMGRWPNSGWVSYQSANGTKSITSNGLSGSPNWKGAEVVIRKFTWIIDVALITSQSGGTLNYNGGQYSGVPNNGFFIQNDPKTLDSQNEWYFNPSTKKLRVYSTSTPSGVKVASIDDIIKVTSKANFIVINNLNVTGANSTSILVDGNTTVTNCDIEFSGNSGITTVKGTWVQNFLIDGNTINHCNNISIGYLGSSRVTITNNTIKNNGIIVGSNSGEDGTCVSIKVNSSDPSNNISYNRLDSSGYNGISFASGNVHHNYVSNFCLIKQDGGAIYTSGGDKNTFIDYNIIRGGKGDQSGMAPVGRPQNLVYGIYNDYKSSGSTARHNTISDIVGFAFHLNDPEHLTLQNNTIFNMSDAAISISIRTRSFKGANFKDNIFYVPDLPQSSAYFMAIRFPTDITAMGDINNNHLILANPAKVFLSESFTSGYSYGYKDFSSWKNTTRNDLNSTLTVKSMSSVRLESNPGTSSKTINLGANYKDVKGEIYNGSVTLAPYTSKVLIYNGAIQGHPITVNAGEDQIVTLPTNKVNLNGSADNQGGSISSYVWTKLSGPSEGIIKDVGIASTSVSDLTEGVYIFQLKATDNTGQSATDDIQITVKASGNLLPSNDPGNLKNGLNFKYYEENNFSQVPDFAKLTPVKSGIVNNFDLSVANRPDIFAVQFNGYIDVPEDGEYTFYTTSDDGSLLYIDDQLVVDNDGLHGAVEKSGKIGLKAGKHAISVGFFEQNGDQVLMVNYAGPGISKQSIPNSALYRVVSDDLLPAVNPSNTVNGINYKYYEGSSYSVVPDFSKISPVKTGAVSNFDISVANRSEIFAIAFDGYINIPSDGQYTFYASSDDGSLLYIDNQLVVDNDGTHGIIERSGTIGLKAGKHAISVGFFQQAIDKVLNVSYAGPGIAKQLIPASSLYRISQDALLPAVNPANTVSGLNYEYYEGSGYTVVPDFSKISPVKKGTVNYFDISVADRQEIFAIDFDGFIEVPADGQYIFYTSSDDGSLLYINNQLVVNNDGKHAITEQSGTIGLKAGKHAISVGFFQQGIDKVLNVSFAGPGIGKQVIPASSLFRIPLDNGLNYSYYEDSGFSNVPDFSKITPKKSGKVSNFDISVANRAEVFAIEFSGYIDIFTEGQYTFYTTSDDGSMLYINNSLIVNNDGRHGAIERSGSVYLAPGQYPISVGFFQQNLNKMLEVKYEGPGLSKRFIPSSVLFSEPSYGGGAAVFGGGQAFASTRPLKEVNNLDEASIKAYPNPFVNSIRVTLNGEAGDYTLQMMDALGRTLWTRTGKKSQGYYQQSVNTSSLQKGVYFLKVVQNDKSSVIKLLK